MRLLDSLARLFRRRAPAAPEDYIGWRIVPWETPVSEVKRLAMVSLTDANRQLGVVFEAYRHPQRPRWKVTFSRYEAYRNTDELHLCRLWKWLDESDQRCGDAFVVDDSPWIKHLVKMGNTLRHFVICTEDDVIEVASEVDPVWEDLGPAPPDAPMPGKKEHFYLPEDRAAVEKLVEEIRSRQEQPPAG